MKNLLCYYLPVLFCVSVIPALAQKPQLVIQTGHADGITSIAISPDDKYVLTGGFDNTAKLWDLSTGRQIRMFPHRQTVYDVAFSADGKQILTASKDKTVKLWDLMSGIELAVLEGHEIGVYSAKFSNDGQYIITGSWDTTAKLWSYATRKELMTFKGHEDAIMSIALSSDNKYLSTASNDNTAKLWNLASGKEIYSLPAVRNILFSADGKYLAGVSAAGSVALFDIPTGKSIKNLADHIGTIESFTFSPDSKYICTVGGTAKGVDNNSLMLWDVSTGKQLALFSGHSSDVKDVVFTHNGKYILSTGYDNTIRVWEALTGKTSKVIQGHSTSVTALAISNDGESIYTGGGDHIVRKWTFPKAKIINKFSGHSQAVISLAISPDGNHLLSGSDDLTARVWETATGKNIQTFLTCIKMTYRTSECPEGVDFSEDGRYFLVATPRDTVKVFDSRTFKQVVGLKGPFMGADAFRFSKDSKRIFSPNVKAENDEQQLIDFLNNKVDQRLPGRVDLIKSASFSPDGNYLLTGGADGIVRLWELASGTVVKTFQCHSDWMTCVDYSPDGKYFITASRDDTMTIWEIASGNLMHTIKGHAANVTSALFTPDGTHIVSASDDATVKVWDPITGELICTFIALDGSDWAVVTPDNYYACSKDATKGVHFTKGLDVFSFENFDLIFNRPDIILERLGIADKTLIDSYRKAYSKRLKKMGIDESNLSNEIHLPEIDFVDTNIPFETRGKTLAFKIKATDSKFTLDRINVYVNDVPIYGKRGYSIKDQNVSDLVKDITLELSNGHNTIQISSLNTKGVESLKRTININYVGPEVKSRLYMVSIGVSEYADADMNLNYAAKDAADLAKLFDSQKGKSLKLLNEAAVKENLSTIKEFLSETKVDDEVIIFVAGHGLLDDKLDWYFGSHDVDFSNPSARGIAYDELENLLDGITARKKLLLMDACNSGEVDKEESILVSSEQKNEGTIKSRGIKRKKLEKGVGLNNSFELMQELFANIEKGSGAMVISSASGAEYALESPEWQNGVFTYSILNGLKTLAADTDKNGKVQVSELRDYVVETVQKLTNGKQHPTSRKENLEYDFYLYER